MQQYHDLLERILERGVQKGDRTGTGTLSVFGHQMRFDLQRGFPLVTTKFTPFRLVAVELLWFLRGETNIKYLLDNNCHIWDEWATDDCELGPVYGKQWRDWVSPDGTHVDQIKELIDGLKNKPNSRRHIVNAWNVADLPDETISPKENAANGKMALPPCHTFFQFYVANNKLSCQLYQRSVDLFLGCTFNIASYALLTHMVAHVCGMEVGEFIHTSGDAHIYLNHIDQTKELLSREPLLLPKLQLNPDVKSIFDFTLDDIKLIDYIYHPAIKASVSV